VRNGCGGRSPDGGGRRRAVERRRLWGRSVPPTRASVVSVEPPAAVTPVLIHPILLPIALYVLIPPISSFIVPIHLHISSTFPLFFITSGTFRPIPRPAFSALLFLLTHISILVLGLVFFIPRLLPRLILPRRTACRFPTRPAPTSAHRLFPPLSLLLLRESTLLFRFLLDAGKPYIGKVNLHHRVDLARRNRAIFFGPSRKACGRFRLLRPTTSGRRFRAFRYCFRRRFGGVHSFRAGSGFGSGVARVFGFLFDRRRNGE
jgi:hypothetical protein